MEQGPRQSKTGPANEQPSTDPPPYHDWTVVPDSALLPPPPPFTTDCETPTTSASETEAERGDEWCNRRPLRPPETLSPAAQTLVKTGHVKTVRPPEFKGVLRFDLKAVGTTFVHSRSDCRDVCLLTDLPLYSALADSPFRTGTSKTIYYEVRFIAFASSSRYPPRGNEDVEAGIALGFVAPPYPTFRLPGWQRGSLGVHGDDGRRFVNDIWDGLDFTSPFKPGETLGIGMTFSVARDRPPAYPGVALRAAGHTLADTEALDVQVFFTRNGRREGGWDLHEEIDMERAKDMPEGVTGLEGQHDLFGAVGIFGAVECEICYRRADWAYRP